MKIKLAAFALLISGVCLCSDGNAQDLLGRMLGRGGCGCDAAPTCCDTPAASCGGRTFSTNIRQPRQGFLSGLRGRGVGCGSYADAGCGCDAPIADCCDGHDGCGVGSRLRGVFGRVRGLIGRNGGCDTGCDMGCDMGCGGGCDTGCGGAPIAAGCGTDFAAPASCGNVCDPCGSRGGLLSGLTGRLRGNGGCGCGSGYDDCGCGAAPVAAGCGCNAAPVSTCGDNFGCGDPCGCGNGFLSGIRGRVGGRLGGLFGRFGGGCGNGCGGCDMGSDCGCGAAPVAAGCGCNGGYAPAQAVPAGQPMQYQAPMQIQQPVEAAPAEGNVVAPPANASGSRIKAPNVDPNSFIIRNTGYRN